MIEAVYRAIMAYSAVLGGSQQLTIANVGGQTQVSSKMSRPGQQQSQSSSFTTGKWANKPQLFDTGRGFILHLEGDRGSYYVLIQQNSVSTIDSPGDLGSYRQVDLTPTSDPSSESMQPMQPMEMGNMSMDINSMKMKMGNMSMGFNNPNRTNVTQFCSQCGTEAKTGDRFCRSCGHELAK